MGRGQGKKREQRAAEEEQGAEGGQPPAPPGAKSRADGPPTTEPRTAGGRGTAPQRQQTGRRAKARPGAGRPNDTHRPPRAARPRRPQAAAVAKEDGGRKQGPRPGGGTVQAHWRPGHPGRAARAQPVGTFGAGLTQLRAHSSAVAPAKSLRAPGFAPVGSDVGSSHGASERQRTGDALSRATMPRQPRAQPVPAALWLPGG